MAQFGGKFEGGSRSIHDDRSPAQHARAWLDKLRDVDVLLIDDLGKGKLSPAVASEMFALVDHRHVNQLVTIWTSNSAPETIAECMTPDMAAPFAGRINESSQIFHFK
jgi:DNA replication protein DnaC